ncbi:hypothetical protein [Streptomyces phage phiScoe54]|nr:hypothetical protein [Streptomyces phage phiScoe54]
MKLRNKIIALFTAAVAGFGVSQNLHHAEAAPGVKVETVATSTPTTLPAKIKYVKVEVPISKLPTKPCASDGGWDCYWDAAHAEVRGGYSYWVDKNHRVTYLVPRLNDVAKRKAWENTQRKAGREFWDTYDGHRFCWAKVGDTSYVYCWDGYKTTT